MPKKIYIRTFGCQMNTRDSEIIKGLLLDKGFEVLDEDRADKADVVLLNTCSVRQHAEEKVWSEIGRLVKKGQSPKGTVPIIGLIGCMAQNYGPEAFNRMQGIDLVVGPNNIDAIPLLLMEALKLGRQSPVTSHQSNMDRRPKTGDRQTFLAVGKRARDEFVYHAKFRQSKDHAYIVISEGCNNFCSYCVVPYVRGQLRNRHQDDILDEIKDCLANGIEKITLLGQNVNAYYGDTKKFTFANLLQAVNSLEGLKEFTFVTSHPKDASTELFKAMAKLDKIKKSLHLPLQSGSDRILKLMNRGYTREHYLGLVKNYRKLVPGGLISTDIIVGFPTETEKDFNNTYDLIKEVKFNSAYIFKYSPRPHTKAQELLDDIPKQEKERRHKILLDYQKGLSADRQTAIHGRDRFRP